MTLEISPLPASPPALAAAGETRAVAAASTKPAAEQTAAEARRTAEERTRADEQEAFRASRAARREQAIQAASGGSIEFEQTDGTRVMKVLDSKDVLIYQVPPKGRLELIKAEQAAVTEALADA